MSKRRLRPEDYTVGWVCALSIELVAAREMLNERHQDLPQTDYDENLYTLGRIGEHNIAITCLPAGQLGNNSAAAAAVEMKRKFRSIQLRLLVGVGGGVPSDETDIRLGDVVISRPLEGYGGVVQYDFGKNTPNGFQRTGYTNSPPVILLNALTNLQANRLGGGSKLSEHLSTFSRLPEFDLSNIGPDLLFEAQVRHAGGPTCEACNTDRLVRRNFRQSQEVEVHYGTIASGNEVIKDGNERDRLSSQLGGVLCFEMEAAGLMNRFSCLVIRGICDYADSHKNKRWQPFAAATAAACAKEILSLVPAAEIVEMGALRASMGSPDANQAWQQTIYEDRRINQTPERYRLEGLPSQNQQAYLQSSQNIQSQNANGMQYMTTPPSATNQPQYQQITYLSTSSPPNAFAQQLTLAPPSPQPGAVLPPSRTPSPSAFSNTLVFSSSGTSAAVIINRTALNPTALALLQRQSATPVQPGYYWYDSRCGAWGHDGGPCLGYMAPRLPLGAPMPADASGPSGTGVFINGRHIHAQDALSLTMMGIAPTPGRWWLEADGRYGREGWPMAMGNLRIQAMAAALGGEFIDTDASKERYDIVIFLGGTNDLGREVPTKKIHAVITETTHLPLQYESRVLTLTVPECGVPDSDLDRRMDKLRGMILGDWRVDVYTLDLFEKMKLKGLSTAKRKEIWDHGLHFSPAGYAGLGNLVADVF